MSQPQHDANDSVLRLVDTVITDLAVGVRRYVGRRACDGDADTFMLQDGEEGRRRLSLPDPRHPATVISMTRTAQRYLRDQLGEPVPRCPVHDHALDLAESEAGYDWVCPAGQWRASLGDYAEHAWPHFSPKLLAPILMGRVKRRGIAGVRSLAVNMGENGLVASFSVADRTPELVGALTEAAAPVGVEVREQPRAPREAVEPVRPLDETRSASPVRLVLDVPGVRRGGQLGYKLVNDSSVPILTGTDFALDQQDDGWWYSIDTELPSRAVGLMVKPSQRRARIPARATPGIYRLRKSIRLDPPQAKAAALRQEAIPAELTAEFRVTES